MSKPNIVEIIDVNGLLNVLDLENIRIAVVREYKYEKDFPDVKKAGLVLTQIEYVITTDSSQERNVFLVTKEPIEEVRKKLGV
jgi:hypothetical protein